MRMSGCPPHRVPDPPRPGVDSLPTGRVVGRSLRHPTDRDRCIPDSWCESVLILVVFSNIPSSRHPGRGGGFRNRRALGKVDGGLRRSSRARRSSTSGPGRSSPGFPRGTRGPNRSGQGPTSPARATLASPKRQRGTSSPPSPIWGEGAEQSEAGEGSQRGVPRVVGQPVLCSSIGTACRGRSSRGTRR